MNLTMDDIENQIAALQIKKKQLEEEKKAADNYIKTYLDYFFLKLKLVIIILNGYNKLRRGLYY
jgi:hypothetical protein